MLRGRDRARQLLDCVAPAPVAARANTCQRIIDLVIGALAHALPERRGRRGERRQHHRRLRRHATRAPARDYLYLETLGGGFGGRNDRDGKDGVQVHITNTSNLPVEAIEIEYPLRVVSYGLVEDSGGRRAVLAAGSGSGG